MLTSQRRRSTAEPEGGESSYCAQRSNPTKAVHRPVMQGQGPESGPYPLARLNGRSVQRRGRSLPLRRSDLYQTVLLKWDEREYSHAPGYECCSCTEDRPGRSRSCCREHREREQGNGEYG